MMLTTGMLMFGKMSVGVRKIESVPRIKIRIASTMNVYGRFSATLTIHMIHAPQSFRPAWPDCINQIDPTVCASESWHPESRSIARLLEARRPFRTGQSPSQESSCRRHGGCRHCPDGLLSLPETLQQTSRAP